MRGREDPREQTLDEHQPVGVKFAFVKKKRQGAQKQRGRHEVVKFELHFFSAKSFRKAQFRKIF